MQHDWNCHILIFKCHIASLPNFSWISWPFCYVQRQIQSAYIKCNLDFLCLLFQQPSHWEVILKEAISLAAHWSCKWEPLPTFSDITGSVYIWWWLDHRGNVAHIVTYRVYLNSSTNCKPEHPWMSKKSVIY